MANGRTVSVYRIPYTVCLLLDPNVAIQWQPYAHFFYYNLIIVCTQYVLSSINLTFCIRFHSLLLYVCFIVCTSQWNTCKYGTTRPTMASTTTKKKNDSWKNQQGEDERIEWNRMREMLKNWIMTENVNQNYTVKYERRRSIQSNNGLCIVWFRWNWLTELNMLFRCEWICYRCVVSSKIRFWYKHYTATRERKKDCTYIAYTLRVFFLYRQ